MTAVPHKLTTLAVSLAAVLSAQVFVAPAGASPAPARGVAATGNDISWPQCPSRGRVSLPGPMPGATFVVLGLTDGGSFRANPCLASQAAAARRRHLWTGAYAISTYPTRAQLARYGGPGTPHTRLARVGRAEAAFNLATMARAGFRSPTVWMDVETRPKTPWSASASANNAVIGGVLAGYRAGRARAGVYSYASAWKTITGARTLPGVPPWVPVGHRGRAAALGQCALVSYTRTRTRPWLVQWTDGVRDYDATCPGITGRTGRGSPLTAYLRTVLAVGSRGAAVAALQAHLGRLTPDGAFGPLTRARVVAFQRSRHLRANGIVTSVVWRALGAGVPYVPARRCVMGALFAST